MMHWDDTFDCDHAKQLAQAICACNEKWELELNRPNAELATQIAQATSVSELNAIEAQFIASLTRMSREVHSSWSAEILALCQGALKHMSAEVNEYRRIAQEAINRYPGPLSDLTGKKIRHKDGDPLNNAVSNLEIVP